MRCNSARPIDLTRSPKPSTLNPKFWWNSPRCPRMHKRGTRVKAAQAQTKPKTRLSSAARNTHCFVLCTSWRLTILANSSKSRLCHVFWIRKWVEAKTTAQKKKQNPTVHVLDGQSSDDVVPAGSAPRDSFSPGRAHESRGSGFRVAGFAEHDSALVFPVSGSHA